MTLETEEYTDVLIVGAGPAGLMLATVLSRFGVKFTVIDDRPDKTSSGRADGLQPKTLETFEQLGLLNQIEAQGVKIFDITFWNSTPDGGLVRTGRENHFPPNVDLRNPYILLLHQGIVEKAFIDDLSLRGIKVQRNLKFAKYSINEGVQYPVRSEGINSATGESFVLSSKYIVGCDGAHSAVRASMPNNKINADTTDLRWAVIDGKLNTDFPDFWSKTVVRSASAGTILGIPRERGLTRLYIELPSEFRNEGLESAQPAIMNMARKIIHPFKLDWDTVEWFSIYRVRQGVATSFIDRDRAFILGDASHTHSANAAQGMNVSMHDSWNIGWKLALVLKGIGKPELLNSFEIERQKVANDLIDFDRIHASAFNIGDSVVLAKNFEQNVRFISGIGAEYDENLLNKPKMTSLMTPGTLPLQVDAIRFIDANPIHMETDIPILGQFRIYFAVKDYFYSKTFLQKFSDEVNKSPFSEMYLKSRSNFKSVKLEKDLINCERYIPVSSLFTIGLVTGSSKSDIELSQLPEFFQPYRWSIYLDLNDGVFKKWFPGLSKSDISILVLRPDGYIGGMNSFDIKRDGSQAARWLYDYFLPLLV